jgi:membrane-associated protease RseP (regulator of RpoE activity)
MRISPSSVLSPGWFRGFAWVLLMMALAGSGRAGADEESTHVRVGRGRVPAVGVVLVSDADGATIHVGRVQADSPAARAGLRSGDRIVTVNGCRVRGTAGWDAALAKAVPGATLSLGVWRAPGGGNGGALIYLQVPTDVLQVPADGAAIAGRAAASRPSVPDAPCEP